jgi:TatD DNase family protein
MKLIDTHCHLGHGQLRNQWSDILAEAQAVGVVRFVCAVGTVEESRFAQTLAAADWRIAPLAGIHPHNAKDADEAALAAIEQLAGQDRCVAVGEIGLDYHYNFSPPEAQRAAFAAQLALAMRLGKPAVIHTREAFGDTMAILADSGIDGRRVLLHSFAAGIEEVRAALAFGATVSFSGIVTFDNAGPTQAAAAEVPADRLLIETDAPYLSPEPVRRIRPNRPAHVAHVAAFLARLRGVPLEALAETTTANAVRFFALPELP